MEVDSENQNKMNFFDHLKILGVSEDRLPVMSKDPIFGVTYLMASSLFVLDSQTLGLKKSLRLDRRLKFLPSDKGSVIFDGKNPFLVLPSLDTLFLYPLSESSHLPYQAQEQRLNFLKDNEKILKIAYINNQVRIF
jgi:hypothetical protein